MHALAVRLHARTVELDPADGAAELALADMLVRSWRLTEGGEALDRAHAKGGVPEASLIASSATLALRRGDVETAIRCFRRLHALGEPAVRSRIAMSSLYADSSSPAAVATFHRELFAHLGRDARPVSSFPLRGGADRPLRVGMVMRDLHRQHPVAIFLLPMLTAWNYERFPLTIYFIGETFDEKTALARRRVRLWRDVPLAALPETVSRDGIDILIDLAGHTNYAQMAAFAGRLAPVQATFLGYPATTVVPNIDYIFGDPVVTPPEHAHLYTETIVRLPHTVFCFAPEADYAQPAGTATANRPLTFGSFNNVPKLTSRTVGLWAAVLEAQPTSRLVLKAPSFGDDGVVARYRAMFADHGIDGHLLEFRGPVGLDDMMAEYADIDIALDPVPYNGGTTTLQAMWMGVPVVTLEGGHFVSRMGASFMRAAGLDEWVASDAAGYVEVASRMGGDRAALAALKAGLRERLSSRPGWNIATYVQDFERALFRMWPPR